MGGGMVLTVPISCKTKVILEKLVINHTILITTFIIRGTGPLVDPLMFFFFAVGARL